MAEQSRASDIHRLSEALNSIQKSLECTICLELMTDPTKTRCGHSFCKSCIGEVLQKKNALCPLCKTSLNRRNVSKDDHQQTCIEKFQKLLIAVQMDCHIDIMSYSKQPHDTKESCSYSDAGRSNSNDRKSLEKQLTLQLKQSSSVRTNKLSTDEETVIDCDNPRYDLKAALSNKSSSIGATFFTPESSFNFAESKNATCNTPNTKVRTWLHSFHDEPSTSALTIENETRPVEREATPINRRLLNDDNKSEPYRDKINDNRRTSWNRKQDTDCSNVHEEDTHQTTESRQFDDVIEIDSGLKYKKCHMRVRAKNRKNLSKPSTEQETNNERGTLTTDADDPSRQIATVDASDNTNAITQHSSANWSRVIKFGKEMKRGRKGKVKKLSVSTERSTNQPRIVEDLTLSPNSKYVPIRLSHDTSRKNISNLEDSAPDRNGRKDTTDNSPDLAKVKASSETNAHARMESYGKNKVDGSIASSNLAMETSYIMLEEGMQVHIRNLDNDQVNQIIGLENRAGNFQRFENRCGARNADSVVEYRDSSISPRKRLTVLTPEKLNESVREREMTHDATLPFRVVTGDVVNPSGILLAENRTPIRENDGAQRTSGEGASSQLRSPMSNKSRLSLRRKLGIDDNKRVDSPLLGQLSSDRMAMDRRKRNSDDANSADSPVSTNDSLFNRLTVVRRDLSLQMSPVKDQPQIENRNTAADASSKRTIKIESSNVSGTVLQDKELARLSDLVTISEISLKSASTLRGVRNQESGLRVKFTQLGPLKRVKRNRVKYFYLDATRRERLMPSFSNVESRTISVCNMISGSETEQRVADASPNLAVFPNPSNDTRDSINTTIENIRFADNLNVNRVVTEDAGSNAASPTCGVSATSTPKKDAARHLSRKTIERTSEIASKRSYKSHEDTVKESAPPANRSLSRLHLLNSVKLLSPEKDSQLQFLTIDSPMSEHEQSKRATKCAVKGNNLPEMKSPRIAASTSKAREPSVERADKKRKRTRRLSDRELFEDGSNDSNGSQSTIKLDAYTRLSNDAKPSDAKRKKHRFSSSDDQDTEVILLDAKEPDAHRRKFKRIILVSSSDTESESTARVAVAKEMSDVEYSTRRDANEDLRIQDIINRWNDEHNAMQRELMKSGDTQGSVKSRRTTEEKSASNRSFQRSNAFRIETRRNASQKSSVAKESDLFESSSMFNSYNVDNILAEQQAKLPTAIQTSEKIVDIVNDDIINRVLQIDRSTGDAGARRSPVYAPSQQRKDSGDYLLQDNFDEIIANVELPRSVNTTPCADQSGRNLNRPLAEQKTSNCLATTDEMYGAMRDTPTIPASSTNDIFENCSYSTRNVRKPPLSTANVTSRNSDKENIVSYCQRKHDSTGERGENGKDTTANVDEIDKDPHRNITSKKNVSREKESFEERDVSIRSTGRLHVDNDKIERETTEDNEPRNDSSEQDTLMNVTLQQIQLQSFEKYLFGAPETRNETKTTRITSQDEFREEVRTPTKRKQDSQDKNSVSEERSAEEDDVVENTPERKMKKGTNGKAIDSRRNIAISYPSPVWIAAARTPSTSGSPSKEANSKNDVDTPTSRLEVHPLCQSTPKVAHSAATNRPDVLADNKEIELVASGSVLSKRVDSKGLENVRQQADRRELCFVCSGLMATQTTIVKEFAMKYGARYVSQFDRDVTHVIVETADEERNTAKSTLKFLQGIAHRKWIVSYRWIEDCIKQQRLLDEVPYEAVTHLDGVDYNGPRDSRLRNKGLFEGFTFLCVGPYVNVTVIQYQDLLLATGAVVVDSLESLAKKGGIKGIVIQDNIHDDSVIEYWYRTAKAAPILDDWIVECIGQYKLFKLMPYILSSQEFCAIGYPPELVEDEDYYDDGE